MNGCRKMDECVRNGPDMWQTRTCSQTCCEMIEGGSQQNSVHSRQTWVVRPRDRGVNLCVFAEPMSYLKIAQNSKETLEVLVQQCVGRVLRKIKERKWNREHKREERCRITHLEVCLI